MAQANGLCSILRLVRKPNCGVCWKEEAVLAGHGGIVSNAHWSMDGRLVLTSSADRTARIWSTSGGALRLVVSSNRSASANGHGQTITSSARGRVLKNCTYYDNCLQGYALIIVNFLYLAWTFSSDIIFKTTFSYIFIFKPF